MRILKNRRAVIAVTSVTLMAGGGAAYAFVNGSQGTATASGNVAAATAFNVQLETPGPVVLDVAQDVDVTVTNPGPQTQALGLIKIVADPDNWDADCGPTTNLVVSPASFNYGGSLLSGAFYVKTFSVTLANDTQQDQSGCTLALKATAN